MLSLNLPVFDTKINVRNGKNVIFDVIRKRYVDLFRTRLADAGMNVRDGFWEELSQEIPVHSPSLPEDIRQKPS